MRRASPMFNARCCYVLQELLGVQTGLGGGLRTSDKVSPSELRIFRGRIFSDNCHASTRENVFDKDIVHIVLLKTEKLFFHGRWYIIRRQYIAKVLGSCLRFHLAKEFVPIFFVFESGEVRRVSLDTFLKSVL